MLPQINEAQETTISSTQEVSTSGETLELSLEDLMQISGGAPDDDICTCPEKCCGNHG